MVVSRRSKAALTLAVAAMILSSLVAASYLATRHPAPAVGGSTTAVSSSHTTSSASQVTTTDTQAQVSSTSPIPTSASLSETPNRGPSGLVVNLAGRGYSPGVRYQVCVGGYGNSSCGFQYTSANWPATIGEFATLGSFVADSTGSIPAGTGVTIPDLFGGNYTIGVVPDGKDVFFVSTPFKVETPTLSLSAVAVASGSGVTLTGSGYLPSTTYTVCSVPAGTVDCGYVGDREETPPGFWIGSFTTDAAGKIPSGTVVAVPPIQPGQNSIGIFLPSGGYILISQADYTLTAAR
jgi:hypothetical protein